MSTLFSEIVPYLFWIVKKFPNSQSEAEIKVLQEAVREKEVQDIKFLNYLKEVIINLMVKDPRLSQYK